MKYSVLHILYSDLWQSYLICQQSVEGFLTCILASGSPIFSASGVLKKSLPVFWSLAALVSLPESIEGSLPVIWSLAALVSLPEIMEGSLPVI